MAKKRAASPEPTASNATGRKKDANGLTKQQYAFCRAFVETGNKAEAYRRSYAAKNMKPATIYKTSAELMKNPVVARCIASLTAETDGAAVKELGLTREWVIEGLMNVAKLGAKTDAAGDPASTFNLSAANAALTSLGKVDTIGLFVERSKIELAKTFDDMQDDELEAFIAANGKVA